MRSTVNPKQKQTAYEGVAERTAMVRHLDAQTDRRRRLRARIGQVLLARTISSAAEFTGSACGGESWREETCHLWPDGPLSVEFRPAPNVRTPSLPGESGVARTSETTANKRRKNKENIKLERKEERRRSTKKCGENDNCTQH